MTVRVAPAKIFLVELTHTYIAVDAKNTPLAIGYIGAYLSQQLGAAADIQLFKYPVELNAALEKDRPEVIAFSNYMWNEALSYAFARRIKEAYPQTTVIFGGPNYPEELAEQRDYLAAHPEIDFCVAGEGEVAFCELVRALLGCSFDHAALKSDATLNIPGVHYRHGDACRLNGPATRIDNIEARLPSPYLTGILDKFFDKNLTPLLQTSRGCPYSCTFCHDGSRYANKTYRYDNSRIRAELLYAAQRSQVPSLTLADLNWGIFPQDLEVARIIKEIQTEYHWPLNIQTATAKNQKDRIVEMSRILGNTMIVGASIQSNDAEVLTNIKRKNIGYEAIVKMAQESANTEASTFTEIILCLPGDTLAKHMQAVFDMLDAGIQDINLYQYILLRGTEGANHASRERFRFETAFRVIPRCFGIYDILGVSVPVSEIHEVVVGNATMSHAEYLDCRAFDLSLMIFNNGRILDEIYRSVAHLGLARSHIVRAVHYFATSDESGLKDIYDNYREDEESNFWSSPETLSDFLFHRGGLDRYIAGERGRNQLHYWKSVAIFERLPQVLRCILRCVTDLLRESGRLTPQVERYFEDLGHFIVLKKGNPTQLDDIYEFASAFDFAALEAAQYALDPFRQPVGATLHCRLGHAPERRQVIAAYLEQYGSDMKGLAHLTHRYPAKILHRAVERL